jgi:uncharacterized phage protein (TIGR02218 family)
MVHNIPHSLKNHIASGITTNSTLWKITRTDGEILSFTDYTEDITYNNITYKSSNSVGISSIATKGDYSVDNLDLIGFLKESGVTNEDIMAELYDNAYVEIFMIDYTDLSKGHLTLKTGYLGNITKGKDTFTAETRGLTQKLSQSFVSVYSPTCRARLGDGKCKIDLGGSVTIDDVSYNLISTGIVQSITDNRIIYDNTRTEPNSFFSFGYITFTSGKNKNQKMEIKTYQDKTILLFLPMNKKINVGDTYTITVGCDKYFNTCINKFSNAVNFRGEPHIPGRDKIYETGSNRSDSHHGVDDL